MTDDNDIIPEEEEVGRMKGKSEKKLRDELKKSQEEKREYLEGWQRAKADLINYKREAQKEKREFARTAARDLVEELLPVIDSFEMAFADKELWEKADENWRKGIEGIYQQFRDVLKRAGVEEVNPIGVPFDPKEHDSVGTVEVETKSEDDIIQKVEQKGYKLGEKLLRAPRVHVGHYDS